MDGHPRLRRPRRPTRCWPAARRSGVFQLESAGMTQRAGIEHASRTNLEDVIALISLHRPRARWIPSPTYIAQQNRTRRKVVYQTPQTGAASLIVTDGVVMYQEQVMQICRELAGFSLARPTMMRRAYQQEKAQGHGGRARTFCPWMHRPGKDAPGCVKNGIPEAVANQIYDDMISFASYAFNKVPRGLLRLRGLPDSLPQVPLPPRVHGRPADQCAR